MSEDYSKDGKYLLPTGEYLQVSYGHKYYFKDEGYSIRHRENGPAIEYVNVKYWYLNGDIHREDGPAIEWSDGHKAWWLNNKKLPVETQLEFEKHKKLKHFF